MATFRIKPVYAVEKLFDGKLLHKGFQLPVAVYLVEETLDNFYHHCVCFENTRFEKDIEIALSADGSWFDLCDRDEALAQSLGRMIDQQTEFISELILH